MVVKGLPTAEVFKRVWLLEAGRKGSVAQLHRFREHPSNSSRAGMKAGGGIISQSPCTRDP